MTPYTFAAPIPATRPSLPTVPERPSVSTCTQRPSLPTGTARPAPTPAEHPSGPAPSKPADVEALGDEIARLSAHMHAAEYRLLTLLREFDEREGWGAGGFRSCAHWLSWRTGLSAGPAREKVRVARALAHLPLIGARMERGQFSYSKVRALTRVATPENEAELIHFAEHATVAQVERLVRGWRRVDRLGARAGEGRRARRSLEVYPDEDGMYVVRGRLEPEVGALLMKALEVAGRELYRADPEASVAQRSADALGEILRSDGGPSVQALLHVAADGRGCGRGCGDGGARTEENVDVSAETSERLTCDARMTEVVVDAGGDAFAEVQAPRGDFLAEVPAEPRRSVLDVGRTRRTVPPRMRRALAARDGGRCRFPGCESTRCDAHHLRHWSRGGETKLENLVLLCRFHHRLVHEGGYRVEVRRSGGGGEIRGRGRGGAPDGAGRGGASRRAPSAGGAPCLQRFRFRRPDGREIPDHPQVDPVEGVGERDLERWHGQRRIDHRTTRILGTGGSVDYGWAIEALRTTT